MKKSFIKFLRMYGFFLLILWLMAGCGSPSGKEEAVQAAKAPAPGNRTFTCFVYHRFGDDRYPSTNISLANFRAHLEYLRAEDFSVMTLSAAVEYARTAGGDQKVAVITVDDGYTSFMTGALPLLNEFNYPATLFVNTETVGSGDYLDWRELMQLKNQGIEIGNHSHSHAYFLNVSEGERPERFRADVLKAQQLFKKHLDTTPKTFAYPYGEFTPGMAKVIETMGFVAAAAQNSGVMHSQGDYYAIPRFPMSDAYAAIDGFAEKAHMEPLRVGAEPQSVIVDTANPPVLTLTFKTDSLATERLQCFVQGGVCNIEVLQEQPVKIRVTAKTPLTRRRTLYTITVPGLNGGWHWYSHLWVRLENSGSNTVYLRE